MVTIEILEVGYAKIVSWLFPPYWMPYWVNGVVDFIGEHYFEMECVVIGLAVFVGVTAVGQYISMSRGKKS